MNKKETKKYYFSVEGETELWYLKWLQNEINKTESKYNVSFDVKVEKNPIKRVKQLSILRKTEIVHIFDFEEKNNEESFKNTLKSMSKAEKMKSIQYILGYSNFTFDLWIILHKKLLNASQNHRNNYLPYINEYYNVNFESMSEYKEEANFKKILAKLSIHDVKKAIDHADIIVQDKWNQGFSEVQYMNYKYFRENPSLDIHLSIKKILKETGVYEFRK